MRSGNRVHGFLRGHLAVSIYPWRVPYIGKRVFAWVVYISNARMAMVALCMS
jgi:hypothetical protein